VQWRRDIGTEAISPPAVVDDLLIYKESVSAIVARSAGDGAEKWRHPIAYAPSLFRPLAVAGGRVFVDDSTVDSTNQPHSPRLVALDTQTGKVAWEAPLTSPSQTTFFGNPTAADDVVYYESLPASGERVLNAADAATGALRWLYPLTGTQLSGDPAFDGGLLFVQIADPAAESTTRSAKLLAIDTNTGALRWTAPLTGTHSSESLAVGSGRVYATTTDGNCWAFDAASGALQWTFQFGDNTPTAPLLAGGSLYFGDLTGKFYALDAATGAERWQASLGSRVRTRAAASGGRLYVGTLDGVLFALDAATGSTLWQAVNPLNKSWPTPFVPPLETEPITAAGALYYFNGTELVTLSVP